MMKSHYLFLTMTDLTSFLEELIKLEQLVKETVFVFFLRCNTYLGSITCIFVSDANSVQLFPGLHTLRMFTLCHLLRYINRELIHDNLKLL